MKPTIKKVAVTSYIYEVTDCEGIKSIYEDEFDAQCAHEGDLRNFTVINKIRRKGVTVLYPKVGGPNALIGYNGVPYTAAWFSPEDGNRIWASMHPLEDCNWMSISSIRCDVRGKLKEAMKNLYKVLSSVGKVDMDSGACHAHWDPAIGYVNCVYQVWDGLEDGFWWWHYDGKRFTTNYPNKFEF